MALADRLAHIMKAAGYDPSPQAEKRREFARLCGLTKDSEDGKDSATHISNILSGRRGNIEEKTARKIARVTDFSWYWLMTGIGAERPYEGDAAGPRESTVVRAASHALEVCLEFHGAGRWSDPTIAAARTLPLDLTPRQWEEKLDEIENVLKTVVAARPEGTAREITTAAKQDEADLSVPPRRRAGRR